MRVAVFQDHQFPYIGRFAPGETIESCIPPENFTGPIAEVPDDILTFFLHAHNQISMAHQLLEPYAEKATWPGEPGDPRPAQEAT
jgi:hypothetical protein